VDQAVARAARHKRTELMITGVHAVIFTKSADEVRAFLRDVLEFSSVDAGKGWLIFALPPAELAAHPADDADHHELYLMCDDAQATVDELAPEESSSAVRSPTKASG
jgi:hypothetical protein